MSTVKSWKRLVLLVSLAAALLLTLDSGPIAKAGQIDIGTSTASWTVTGAGAAGATPYKVADGITISSDRGRNGTFVTGGSLANFSGYWYGEYDFTLPSDATNISLTYSNLYVDDRVVVELNGTDIGSWYLNPTTTSGVMEFAPASGNTPYTFTNGVAYGSGSATSGFIVGGLNTLKLIVNNTDDVNPMTPTRSFQDDAAVTYVQLDGGVTFLPEPATLSLLALGGLALLRRKRGN
jgi:hypothetical protein